MNTDTFKKAFKLQKRIEEVDLRLGLLNLPDLFEIRLSFKRNTDCCVLLTNTERNMVLSSLLYNLRNTKSVLEEDFNNL